MPKMRNGGVTMDVIESRVSTLRDAGWTLLGDESEGVAAPTIPELRAQADAEGIDLGKLTKKADIVAAIEAFHTPPVTDEAAE